MKSLSAVSFAVIVGFVLCRLWVVVLKILEGKEILKNKFSLVGEVKALLQTLVYGLACSGLQMCLHLCDGLVFLCIYRFYYNSNILISTPFKSLVTNS